MAALPAPTHAPLRIRELGPADAALVEALHAALSSRSRYRRYHGAKPVLNRADLAFLAGTDGHDHVAFVALDLAGNPVGIARYVRVRGEPGTAEIAAEVADAWQGQGIGFELIGRLVPRAAASGVCRFSASVLSHTGLTRSLVRRGWRVTDADGPTTALGIDVWALLTQRRVAAR